MKDVTVLAFDADDTLWHSENYFQDVQQNFITILDKYAPHDEVQDHLHETEIRNIQLFGYGVKGFTLSMIETAIQISNRRISASDIHDILMLGKGIFDAPLDLLDGVETVLKVLQADYRLLLITKGDVLDQRNKIEKSGLEHYFTRTEVVQEKDTATYAKFFIEYDIAVENVAMIGNSLRSDVLPILELGGTGIHIPYHVTAHFEKVADQINHPKFHRLDKVAELPDFIQRTKAS